MKTKKIICLLKSIVTDTSSSLDERVDRIFSLRESENWTPDIDIECFKMLIAEIKEEQAIATHVRELLQIYVLLAEVYVETNRMRPLEQISCDVREILRDTRIAWDVIDETVPRIIDALEDSVYNHENYRLMLVYLDKAFHNERLDKELKGRVRHFLKLHILLDEPYSWHNHLLSNELQVAMASLFTPTELMKILINPTIGSLKRDPVEYTYKWEEIYYEVEEYLNERFANAPRQMGFCFKYWSVKREYLKENFNIDWKSPAQMNPRVVFD